MPVSTSRVIVAVLLFTSTATASTSAAPSPPRGEPQFWDAYWHGLMLMRDAQWAKAIEAFSLATQKPSGDARALLARGIVKAILADFAGARDDLGRASFLKSREPKLWEHAVDAMSGVSTGGRGIPIPRSLQKPGQPTESFSGVPGHIIQGRDDYTTDYASAVVYELAMPYRTARENRQPLNSPSLEAARHKVGRWFANRMLATSELLSRNFDESKRLIQRNDLAAARELIELARSVGSADADMALLTGTLWLKAGRPATARREFTIAATLQTNLADAYLGRAEAAAMMGDARTARADLSHAARYGNVPAGVQQRIDLLINHEVVNTKPVTLLAEMDKGVADGATVEQLLPIARRLHRVAANQRLRYDERYQDNVRRLEDAIRADKSAVQPRVELAQYLHDEAELRGAEVEPLRGVVPFRWQDSRQSELNRALTLTDEALRVDSTNVSAIVTKAHILTALDRGTEAERLVDAVTQSAGPGNADAIRLLAMYRRRQISRMLTAAGALRTPSFSMTTDFDRRSDGVWRTTRIIRRDPSRADLALAAAMQQQARALIQQTKQLMESAVNSTHGTLDGLLLESAYEDWFGSRNKALELVESAVKAYPKSLKAHDSLVAYLHSQGQHEKAIRQEAVAWSLFQTTCAPLLRLIWQNVPQKGWPASLDDLQRARELDPTDARASAYLAFVHRDLRDAKMAIGMLKVAVALEQARLELDDQGMGRRWPRPAEDMANLIQLHQELAMALKTTGNPEEALIHSRAAIELASRYPPDGASTPMFGAMRPSTQAVQIPAAKPPNGATVAAQAHYGLAQLLLAAGQRAEARKELVAAVRDVPRHDRMVPNIGNRHGDTNFDGFADGVAGALIELARMDIADNQTQSAFQTLQTAVGANPTPDQRREINDLNRQLIPSLNRPVQPGQPNPGGGPSMAAALIAQAKEQIRRRDYRGAQLTLGQAAQRRPTPLEQRKIQVLIIQIARDGKGNE